MNQAGPNHSAQPRPGERFANCTVTGSCEAVCPKNIDLGFIPKMNRDYAFALLKGQPAETPA